MVSLGQNIAEYLGCNYLLDHINACDQGCNWVQLVICMLSTPSSGGNNSSNQALLTVETTALVIQNNLKGDTTCAVCKLVREISIL